MLRMLCLYEVVLGSAHSDLLSRVVLGDPCVKSFLLCKQPSGLLPSWGSNPAMITCLDLSWVIPESIPPRFVNSQLICFLSVEGLNYTVCVCVSHSEELASQVL